MSALPGSLQAQSVRCGKSSCRCARGDLHGPYWYHFHRNADGQLVKTYIRKADVDQVKAACERWQELEATYDQICSAYNAIGWGHATDAAVRFLDAFGRLYQETWQQLAAAFDPPQRLSTATETERSSARLSVCVQAVCGPDLIIRA